jgi:hypothetical protein
MMDDQAERMKLQRDATFTRLTEKLGKLENYVSGTVESVTDSVKSARDSVDLKLQVRRRPWTLVAGAVALGLLGGYRSRPRERRPTMRNGAASAAPPNQAFASPEQCACVPHDNNGAAASRPRTDAAATRWAKSMGHTLDPEFARLKSFAVGVIAGLARDALMKHASQPEKASAGSRGENGRG